MLKRLLVVISLLLLANPLLAQQTLSCGSPQNSFTSTALAPTTAGTPYALYNNLLYVTWQVSYGTVPTAISVSLQGSLDNSIWSTIDTSTSTAGDLRNVAGSYRFVRAYINSHTGGTTLTVSINCTRQTGGGGSGYSQIEDEDSAVTKRNTVNFEGGGVSCVDDTTKTTCTITGLAASAYDTVQNEGVGVTQRTTIDFAGTGIDCVDSGGTKTLCTVTSGGGGVDTSGTPVLNDIARFTDADTIEGRSYAELKADLDLEIGTDVQAFDTDLSTYAGITPSANVQTLLGAADYAAFKTSLSLNNVENTALSTWAGSANITTLGTITAGTWTGTDIALGRIAAASAESKLLGRGAGSGAGDFQEITLGTGLSMSGTTLNSTGSGYGVIDDEDTPLTQRTTLNFEGGGITCADDTNQTTCTVPSGSFSSPGAGIIVDTVGDGTLAARTLTAGTGITVANGAGAAGNPTISVDTTTTPQYSSDTGSPPATCNKGEVYLETDVLRACICSDTNTWTCNGKLRAHATDCTALTDGIADEMCFERDANTTYVCEPSAGGCDTAGEWTAVSGGSGAPTTSKYIVAEADGGLSAEIAPSAADQIPVSDSTTAATWQTLPNCTDTGGNHLNYNSTTNAFSCGTSGGVSGYATVDNEDTPLTQRTTLNFEGAGVDCADDTNQTTCTIAGGGADNTTTDDNVNVGNGSTSDSKTLPNGTLDYVAASNTFVSSPLNYTAMNMVDEFFSTKSPGVGLYLWEARNIAGTGAGLMTAIAAEAGHPGIIRNTTSTANGDATGLGFSDNNAGFIYPLSLGTSGDFTSWWTNIIFRTDVSSVATYGGFVGFTSQTTVFSYGANVIGLAWDTTSNTCTSGSWSTSNFVLLTTSSSADTCTDTGVAFTANTWYRAEIYSTTAGTVSVKISTSGGAYSSPVSNSTNVPTAGMSPSLQVITRTTAARTVDYDRWGFIGTGASR